MQARLRVITSVCLTFFAAVILADQSAADDRRMRAKIGIQVASGDQITRAGTQDLLKTGDRFRIYVHPEEHCIVYTVHSDAATVSLLNLTEQKVRNSTIILPSAQSYYQLDGSSRMEAITIICSPYKLPELAPLEAGTMRYGDWQYIQADLTRKNRIIQPLKNQKPFSIAGNVRGINESSTGDSFIKQLQIYSGKDLLIRHYEFRVEK